MADIIDVEFEGNVDFNKLPSVFKPEVTPEQIIDKNLKKVEHLYNVVKDPDITMPEKMSELLRIKTALLGPAIQMIGDPDAANPDQAMFIRNAIAQIDNLEASMYKKAEFETAQEVDFHHPKIQIAFKFIFEAVVEQLQEFLSQSEIDIFTQQFSITVTGIEDELNKRLKGLSASVLSSVSNPLLRGVTKKD